MLPDDDWEGCLSLAHISAARRWTERESIIVNTTHGGADFSPLLKPAMTESMEDL